MDGGGKARTKKSKIKLQTKGKRKSGDSAAGRKLESRAGQQKRRKNSQSTGEGREATAQRPNAERKKS